MPQDWLLSMGVYVRLVPVMGDYFLLFQIIQHLLPNKKIINLFV